ncbi:MAG: type II toxin-antitoxin system VapB family antitoxin [Actinomycetota bacterium]|nr:type II toxin-antitoxin system VapB family antitoxin [Actinomycetota bacterium]
MARTNIDIDEDLVAKAMAMYGCKTKREAVDLALRRLIGDPMSLEEALAMRGRGWGGDLDAMRFNEHADWTDRP